MKIIYLHQYFNTPGMAGGTRSYELARRLVAAGHEVHMVTSWRAPDADLPPGRWRETLEAGIHVHWLANPYENSMPYAQRIRSFLRFALRSAGKAAALKGDLVLATSTPLTIAIPGLYAKWRGRIPMVFEVRDLWPEGPIRVGALKSRWSIAAARWLERRAYFGAAHVVALSPEMKAGVQATGYPGERITVIPNSCDLDLFRVSREVGQELSNRHPEWSGGKLVVYVGTLGMINGVEYLAEIAAEMAGLDASVRFLVVGEGKEEGRIRERAEELGVLGRNLWMWPPVPKSEVPAILSASRICASLVVPQVARKAQSANKVFDAFAAGRPLLVNHGGWIADLVRETGAGVLVPERDAQVAAQILCEFLHDVRRQEAAGAAAAQLAETRFSRDLHAETLRRIVESVAADGSEARRGRKSGSRRCYRTGKRLVDLVLASAGLVLMSPVLLAVAIGVRLALGRPVFFSAERAGLGGRPFRLWKFRSMTNETGPDGQWLPDERRLTGFGRFLRRSSLDELPQLIHVWKGEMSLVGPRPLPVAYGARYTPRQATRLQVKPGLTGWSQVGYRGPGRTWEERLEEDAVYVERAGMVWDLWILLLTGVALCRRWMLNSGGLSTAAVFEGRPGGQDHPHEE